MDVFLGAAGVFVILGICCLALWKWREYLIGYFISGGSGPGDSSAQGSTGTGQTDTDGGWHSAEPGSGGGDGGDGED
jgi:hypothetical protein